MKIALPNKKRKVLNPSNASTTSSLLSLGNGSKNDSTNNNNNADIAPQGTGAMDFMPILGGDSTAVDDNDTSIVGRKDKKKQMIIPMVSNNRISKETGSAADERASAGEDDLPVLLRSLPPELRAVRDEKKRLELDIQRRPMEPGPDESAYSEVPVEGFGHALLLGMNFDEKIGIGIGKNARIVQPYSFQSKPAALGMGRRDQTKTLHSRESESEEMKGDGNGAEKFSARKRRREKSTATAEAGRGMQAPA